VVDGVVDGAATGAVGAASGSAESPVRETSFGFSVFSVMGAPSTATQASAANLSIVFDATVSLPTPPDSLDHPGTTTEHTIAVTLPATPHPRATGDR
jgi:hypothetical protein